MKIMAAAAKRRRLAKRATGEEQNLFRQQVIRLIAVRVPGVSGSFIYLRF